MIPANTGDSNRIRLLIRSGNILYQQCKKVLLHLLLLQIVISTREVTTALAIVMRVTPRLGSLVFLALKTNQITQMDTKQLKRIATLKRIVLVMAYIILLTVTSSLVMKSKVLNVTMRQKINVEMVRQQMAVESSSGAAQTNLSELQVRCYNSKLAR